MPDLVTHVAISHLIKRPFELRHKDETTFPLRTLFYLGTILPDILTRPWYILFPKTNIRTFPLHTPVGMLLVCVFLALFFEKSIRKRAFINLILGALLHFFLDGFQKYILTGHLWLFPFSWKGFGYGIVWAGDILPTIPLWIGLVLIMELGIYVWQKKKKRIPPTESKASSLP